MNERYIGVFDSGFGGLTLVKALEEALPEESIVFLADNAHMPYGTKSQEEIISYSHANADFLARYDLKALVIACNTSDSIAGPILKAECPFPVFGVIAPAARKALQMSTNKRIGIIATPLTAKTMVYDKTIKGLDENARVFSVGCPGLADLVEDGSFINDKERVKAVLSGHLSFLADKDIDTLILGCTHYDVLAEMAGELTGKNIVSSSRCVIEDIASGIPLAGKGHQPERLYFCSGDSAGFEKTARLLMDDIRIEKK